MAELPAALLYSQIKKRELIKKRREKIYNFYLNFISKINTELVNVLNIQKNIDTNYHLFCLIFKNQKIAKKFYNYMRKMEYLLPPIIIHYTLVLIRN